MKIPLEYAFLLKINKHHKITDRSKVNLQKLSQIIIALNQVKSLSDRELDDFIQAFVEYLEGEQN